MQDFKVNFLRFDLSRSHIEFKNEKYDIPVNQVIDFFFFGYVSFKKPMKIAFSIQTNRTYTFQVETTELWIKPTLNNILNLYWLSSQGKIDI